MKDFIRKCSAFMAAIALGTLFCANTGVFAEDATDSEEPVKAATSISISPVYKVLQISENSVYEDSFNVSNNGTANMTFEVYAAPYSYTYSEDSESYQLGFSKENTYTQITRWITFQDSAGNYVEKATFTALPNTSVEVKYKISTPASIPAGGQYAVLFAHTISGAAETGGIKTEASPGLVVYGRSTAETNIASEISDLQIHNSTKVDNETKGIINGTAKVKNTGNVDFMASGTLKVMGVFGNVYYETPTDSTRSRISVIPESELTISDSWDDTAYFGLFNVSWTVSIADGESQTIEKLVLLLPVPIIVVMILLLTIIIIWIIITIRKRQERRSRFTI
ncbi:MAG: hypothetical protein Q4B65_02195 [Candidatus Saccharibacteria bacterium]|nr:hypothetical protein [Candidatus Saccharibacteria bacterium]